MGKVLCCNIFWAEAITKIYYYKHLATHVTKTVEKMADYTRGLCARGFHVMVCAMFHPFSTCVYVSDTACTSLVARAIAGTLDESVPFGSFVACITAELLWPYSAPCIAVFSVYVANLYLLFICC